MAEVTMPRLSDTMTEGTIARWVKQQGEQVQKGDVLVEIETDKATMELEAYEAGVVEQVLVQEGQTVAIGQPIARIGGSSQDGGSKSDDASPSEATAQRQKSTQASERPQAPAPGDETGGPQPAASGEGTGEPMQAPGGNGQKESGADSGGAPSGVVTGARDRPVEEAPEEDGVRASPMARRIARERGIDLHTIKGSGPGGRIVRADVEGAGAPSVSPATPDGARTGPQPPPEVAATPVPGGAPDQDVEELPLSNIRRVTGRRMVESIQSAPHFFLTAVVDVTELVALRAQINQHLEAAGENTRVTLNDLIVKACAQALRASPDVNVSFGGDKILRKKRIHIGIAVAIENGLIVPVLRDADQKNVSQLARESKALIERARTGKLTPPEFTGSTFTVSNLGMFGVEHFTAVINPPEAGILAVGASAAEPVVVDGKVEVRERMRMTLSVDHRALDGATGAKFLQLLKGILQAPMRVLV